MRCMWIVVLAACGGESEQPPDAAADRSFCERYICLDHTVWQLRPQMVDEMGFCPPPDFIGVEAIATCENGCRDNGVRQGDPFEACVPPTLEPFTCSQAGACTDGQQAACEHTFACDVHVTYGACTCDQGAWSCASACRDGVCDPSEVQQAIAGTWRGNIVMNASDQSLMVTLEIAANGDWRARDANGTLVWGGGGTPGSTIFIQAQTNTGAYGIMRVFGAYVDAVLQDVRVEADRLRGRLTVICNESYTFDLQRVVAP